MAMAMFFWVKKVVPALIVAADGSGDFNDIQSAIDALPDTGGGIFVKAGIYNISTAITINKSNVEIKGTGISTRIISSITGGVSFGILNADNVTVSDLYIEGPDDANTIGFYFNGTSHCSLLRCEITKYGGGVFMYAIEDNAGIKGCYIHENLRDGIFSIASSSFIDNNRIINNVRTGVYLDSGNQQITNNIIMGNDSGDTASYDGILIFGVDDCLVSGNICLNNDRYEIYIFEYSRRTIVTDNICNGTDHEDTIIDNGIDTQMGHNTTA